MPFARAVASVALEAAVLVGWPIGWALAAFALAERGEARVLAMLGERPFATTARLVPLVVVFGAILAGGFARRGARRERAGTCPLGSPARRSGLVCVDADAGRGRRSAPWCCLALRRLARRASRRSTAVLGRSEWAASERPLLGARDRRRARRPPHRARRRVRRVCLRGGRRAVGHERAREARALPPPPVRPRVLAPARRGALRSWRRRPQSRRSSRCGCSSPWSRRALALWRLHALLLGAAGPVASLALLHALERRRSADAASALRSAPRRGRCRDAFRSRACSWCVPARSACDLP